MCRKYLRLGDIGLAYTLLLTPSPDPLVLCSITDPFIIIRHTRYSSPILLSDWLTYAPRWGTGLPGPGPYWPDAGDIPT